MSENCHREKYRKSKNILVWGGAVKGNKTTPPAPQPTPAQKKHTPFPLNPGPI